MENIIEKLKSIRVHVVKEEVYIHNKIKEVLDMNGIGYTYEKHLGKGNRIDFLLDNGVGIEVKKGKPNLKQVEKQVTRYLEFEEVNSIIVVIERSIDLPEKINGKICNVVGLNQLWF